MAFRHPEYRNSYLCDMSNQEVQNIIINYLKDYDPEYIGIFGSHSRKQNKPNSDLDLLVKFKISVSLLQLIKIENDLTEKIGIKIDLVTEGALKNEIIKRSIQNDLNVIYKT